LAARSLDPLGELDLLVGREQRVPGDLAQEQRHRVRGLRRELAVGVAGLALGGLAAVVAELEAALLEHLLHCLGLVVVEFELVHHLAQLRELDAVVSARVAALGEFLDRLERLRAKCRLVLFGSHALDVTHPVMRLRKMLL
jgi:hypothetical protein